MVREDRLRGRREFVNQDSYNVIGTVSLECQHDAMVVNKAVIQLRVIVI